LTEVLRATAVNSNSLHIMFKNFFEGSIVMQHLEDIRRRNNLTCYHTGTKGFDDIYRTISVHDAHCFL